MNKKLKEKFDESVNAVLPITVIVLLLSIFVVPMETGTIALFLVGAFMLIIGMAFFQLGAETAMTPLGEGVGSSIMKTRKAKIMALMAAATLSIFSAGSVMAAENGDFYPQPVNSDWEDAHTEGAYASFTNGSDYVNIYKYALDDAKIGVAKCNDTYEACYQTIFSEGNSLYMAVGYARDADDIGEVRKMVESISYPGNPTLTGKDGKGGSSDNGSSKDSSSTSSDKNTDGGSSSTDTTGGNSGSGSSDSSDSSKDSDILSTADLTLYDSEGNTVSVERTIYSDYSSKYVGDDGTVYTTDDEVYFTDENGKTWQALNDDTHYMGAELEQHVLTDADGNSVTVTETTNGDYYYRDDNGTGFTDNGDGTWSDENGNSYNEMN